MRSNGDWNAGRNIGQRLLARYLGSHQEKPLTRAFFGRFLKGKGVSLLQEAENG
jgi:hypothetical protein